jgi:DNA-binding Lrp family transcriptional regulator
MRPASTLSFARVPSCSDSAYTGPRSVITLDIVLEMTVLSISSEPTSTARLVRRLRSAALAAVEESPSVDQDWDAVSRALLERLAETGRTQTELAAKAQVSLTTVRELVHNLNARRRHPRTLAALSVALGWPEGHLDDVLRGRSPEGDTTERRDSVVEELRAMREQLVVMQDEIAAVRERNADLASIKDALDVITARLASLEGE